jgi:SAM-dependent methyltransferase
MATESEEQYTLPRNQSESARLQGQHEVYTEHVGYLLHPTLVESLKASKTDGVRIADIGTGTGAWLLDIASSPALQFTKLELVGLDISDAQFPAASSVPQNCTFDVLNILAPVPEKWKGTFDVVNLRLLVCGFSTADWAVAAKNVMRMLKSGGWVQWCESEFPGIHCVVPPSLASSRAAQARRAPGMQEKEFGDFILGALQEKHGMMTLFKDQVGLLGTLKRAGFQNCEDDVVDTGREMDVRLRRKTVGIQQPAMNALARAMVKMHPEQAGKLSVDVEELIRQCEEDVEEGAYW